jgi:fucose 4-O-acetylase-like acetyltransferase
MKQERNILIDVLKGFAILLVVLGHSVQYNLPGHFDGSLVFRVIYSFHMPLFMFLSGYVNFGSFDGSFGKLSQRLKSLIIPYFSWFLLMFGYACLFAYFRSEQFPDYQIRLLELVKSPDRAGLWFLWVLALNCLILFVSLRITRKYEEAVLLLFVILLNLIIAKFKISYAGIVPLSWHLIFFSLGYVTAKYQLGTNRVFKQAGIVSLIVFPFLAMSWDRGTHMPLFLLLIKEITWGHLLQHFYSLLVPVSGVLASFSLFNYLTSVLGKVRAVLVYCGRLTLEIYSTHFVVFGFVFLITGFPYWLKIILSFIVALAVALVIQSLVNKSRWLAFFLYGKPIEKSIPN